MSKFEAQPTAPASLQKSFASGMEDLAALEEKLEQDSRFLRDRIQRIKNSKTPSSTVLNTYISMLKDRESILSWIRQQPSANPHQSQAGGAQEVTG